MARSPVHRSILVVDVEGFGARWRSNENQVVVRDGLYRVLKQAFGAAAIPWAACDREDRGDGVFVLAPPGVPKVLFVEALPQALVRALVAHNDSHCAQERIRLRMVLHAGEVTYDDHGVTAASINLAFRLLDAQPLKDALAASPGVLGLIASDWFFDEVVRHSRVSAPGSYRRVEVVVKETTAVGWIRLPDQPGEPAGAQVATFDRSGAAEPVGGLGAVADELAAVVRKQWQDEAIRRELNDPYPLSVRWVPAPAEVVADWAELVRLATQGVGWSVAHTERTWARSMDELAGCAGDLAAVWDRVPTGRLVVLGEPGAGKTMLLVRLVLDLLASGRRKPGGPVPVLVSAASWDPSDQDLYSWLAGRLTLDYPGLGRTVAATSGKGTTTLARALLDHGLIMMLLDGLDEIPAHLRGRAIAGINQVMRPGQPLIVSSRSGVWRSVVRPPSGVEVTLTGATGIELCAMDRHEVIAYLRSSAGGPAGARRWDRVADALSEANGSAVGQALSTPLMAMLARVLYNPRPGEDPASLPDPDALLTLSTRREVEEHLFDGFVPAAYRAHPARRSRWRPGEARRWLGYLAYHLERDHGGAPDLAWWRLSIRVGSDPPTKLLIVATGCLVAVIATVIAAGPPGSLGDIALGGVHVLVETALVFGIVYWLTGRLRPAVVSALIAVIAGGLASGLPGDTATNGPWVFLDVGLPVGLAAGFTFSLKPGAPTGLKAGLWVTAAVGAAQGLTGLLTIGLNHGLSNGLDHALFAGTTGGLAAGLIVGLMTTLASQSRSSRGATLSRRWTSNSIATGALTGTVVWLTALAGDGLYGLYGPTEYIALGYGVAAGLATGLVTRVASATAATPHRRWTRRPILAGLIAGLGLWVAIRLAGALEFALTQDPIYGISYLLDRSEWPAGVVPALTAGFAVALVTKFVSTDRSVSAGHPAVAGARTGLAACAAMWLVQGLSWSEESSFEIAILDGLAYGMLFGLLAGLVTRLTTNSSPAAHRSWTCDPVVGVGIGLFYTIMATPFYGLGVGVTVALAIELASRLAAPGTPAPALSWTRNGVLLGAAAGFIGTIIMGYHFGWTTGLAVGFTIWVTVGAVYGLDAPRDITEVRAPARVLSRDRTIFILITLTIMLAITVAARIPEIPIQVGIAIGLSSVIYGFAGGVLVAAGRTAWARFFPTRVWLALTGRAPWSMMTFLSDAHLHHGVLRQNGATYQFRHVGLQHRLAATYLKA